MHLILAKNTKEYSTKKALIFKDQSVDFSQLNEEVLRLANALKSLGLEKGDKVAVYLPNCLEYVYAYLASFALGAVVVPLDYMLKQDELVSCLEHSESRFLIARPKRVLPWQDIQAQLPKLERIIACGETLEGAADYHELVSNNSTEALEVVIEDADPSLIMYTSGTTGRPKGILLNYKHLKGSPEAMKHFVDLTDNDIKLAAIPFSHIGGFIYIQNCVHFGITLVIMDRFNPMEFLQNIQDYKVTCFHIVPPMYTAILTLKDIGNYDLSSLRWVVVFGAPSSPEIMERFHKYCPNAKLLNGWGMTETCPPNTVTPMDSDNIASVGKPSPLSEIKIFGEKDSELPSGEIGEVVIRGWVIMDEYYKDPEMTSLTKKNGWLYTGDLGKFDAEGFLYIVGRKKEMIKVAGQIVYAPEVEEALYKHEDILEVAVIGVDDAMRGEVVKAFVVLKEGAALLEEDIRYFAREHLAKFKVPQYIEIRKELSKNRTGKIDKEQLKGCHYVDTNG